MKPTIDEEAFRGLWELLKSEDDADTYMALQVIQNHDFRSSLARILYLYKNSRQSGFIWQKHSPELATKLVSIGVSLNHVPTMRQMLRILVEQEVGTEQLEFLIPHYAEILKSELERQGLPIESVEIKLKR